MNWLHPNQIISWLKYDNIMNAYVPLPIKLLHFHECADILQKQLTVQFHWLLLYVLCWIRVQHEHAESREMCCCLPSKTLKGRLYLHSILIPDKMITIDRFQYSFAFQSSPEKESSQNRVLVVSMATAWLSTCRTQTWHILGLSGKVCNTEYEMLL